MQYLLIGDSLVFCQQNPISIRKIGFRDAISSLGKTGTIFAPYVQSLYFSLPNRDHNKLIFNDNKAYLLLPYTVTANKLWL